MGKQYFILRLHDYKVKRAEFGAEYRDGILRWTFSITAFLGTYRQDRLEPTIFSEDILQLRDFKPRKWTEACDRTITWKEGVNTKLHRREACTNLGMGAELENGTLILGRPEGNLVRISIKGECDDGDRIVKVKAAAMAEFTGVHFTAEENHPYSIAEVVGRLGPQFDLSDYELVSFWHEHGRFFSSRLIPKMASEEYRYPMNPAPWIRGLMREARPLADCARSRSVRKLGGAPPQ